ncbi:MAG: lysophospholipid acyltransferase family protein, partial [Thermodesulfobacteriaceae bacterium]|nr:lysophospholipid acyltransferase family protein [Thermodesulfobacteriaceae bacterium]
EYNIRFLAKKSLFDIPFFGWGIKALGYIPVEREDPKEGLKSLLLCIERLKDNISLVIFPEGTRSKSGELLPFKKAGFLIPIKAKVNVVPIVLWGTVKILPKGALWFKLKEREVRVIVGSVLSVEELTPKEKDNLVIKTREVMEEALKKLKVL